MMAESSEVEEDGPQCYCGTTERIHSMIRCQGCNKWFHPSCLKTGLPSPLAGDIFYNLNCSLCADDGEEDCSRMKLQWLQVVMLALYNLQLSERGKCGFYRWKEHICTFIDKHWNTFFGPTRKKTMTWFGTVAGTLSSGCPQYFKSGANELKEHGWWSLSEAKPPTLETLTNSRPIRRPKMEVKEPIFKVEGLRTRRSKTSFESAMELKAKRAMTVLGDASDRQARPGIHRKRAPKEAKDIRKATRGGHDRSSIKELLSSSLEEMSSGIPTMERTISRESIAFSDESSNPLLEVKREVMEPDFLDQDSSMSMSSVKSDTWYTVQDLMVGDKVPEALLMGDEEELESDFEVDPCGLSPAEHPSSPIAGPSDCLPRMEEILASLESKNSSMGAVNSVQNGSQGRSGKTKVKDKITANQGPIDNIQIKEEPMDISDTDNLQKLSTVSNNKGDSSCTTKNNGTGTNKNTTTGTDKNNYLGTSKNNSICASKNNSTGTNKNSCNEPKAADNCGAESDSDSDSDDDDDAMSQATSEGSTQCTRQTKRRNVTDESEMQMKPPEPKYMAMSIYEEKLLLQRLSALGDDILKDPKANRLKRKLTIRQLKRERGLPLFNLDAEMKHLIGSQMNGLIQQPEVDQSLNPLGLPTTRCAPGDFRVLDRYQKNYFSSASSSQQPRSFLNRLVGTEDDQLQSTCSPYTARMLKPFIRRDYESRPLKMRLLQEVQAYPNRNDPNWQLPMPYPIDYCYVRPQHIASVNALCREFFWPGIDMSECLQYPDFSCVVLYRKFVIGFAFLVPDVKYNEAYISFIFTHPEWRGAGIGTFVLYHLIQTCMGKDVCLHVSASNPAMVLYQKFGFKPKEFILDFYDKYFPVDSKECRHAFFLKLQR